jgi:hypothetical protein
MESGIAWGKDCCGGVAQSDVRRVAVRVMEHAVRRMLRLVMEIAVAAQGDVRLGLVGRCDVARTRGHDQGDVWLLVWRYDVEEMGNDVGWAKGRILYHLSRLMGFKCSLAKLMMQSGEPNEVTDVRPDIKGISRGLVKCQYQPLQWVETNTIAVTNWDCTRNVARTL